MEIDNLVFSVFKNFEASFMEYKQTKKGLFNEILEKKNIQKVEYYLDPDKITYKEGFV